MVRQNYFVNTTIKNIDVETSFAGGMADQFHPEKMADNQVLLMENCDLYAGGVARARGAYSQKAAPSSPISGMVQGRFIYEGTDGPHDLLAIGGNLYRVDNGVYNLLPITGLSSFQTTRKIGSVQYRDKMYIATGSGIVIYDGTTASAMTAYEPTGLEALYVGTNGYAVDPDTYLTDATGAADTILGVTPDQRYGVINKTVTFTAHVETVIGDSLEYQFETKASTDVDYVVTQTWGSSKTYSVSFSKQADYQLRVSMRKTGTTLTLSQYVLPRYRVNNTPDTNPEPDVNFADLSTCNQLFFMFNRLFMYGSTVNPDYVYISDLNNFSYFPRTNTMTITDPFRGSIQAIVPFRDVVVVFTDGSIQMLTGSSPTDFALTSVHTNLGTLYPESIQVMRTNYIMFVANDYNIYILKPVYFSTDVMDVQRINESVRDTTNELLRDSTNVLSCIYNNQYYLYIEGTENLMYRFYYDQGLWVRDNLPFKLTSLDCPDNVLLASGTNGELYELDSTVYVDGVNTPYNMHIITKDYDFGLPHHRKKLKEYQLLAEMTEATLIEVDIYTDNTLALSTMLSYDMLQDSDAQKLKTMVSGRFRYVKTEITVPVKETVKLIGFGFVYKLNTPK